MLQPVIGIDQIERLGRLAEVAQKFLAGNALKPAAAALVVAIAHLPIREFHHHHEVAADQLHAFQREQEGMADRLDLKEGVELLIELMVVARIGVIRAGDELDRFVQAARGLALPNLAKSASAERFDQYVPRQRLFSGGFPVHRVSVAIG